MTEKNQLTDEKIKQLQEPLPDIAIKQHPTKKYLSTINSIYVIERLNEVFGVGQWTQDTEIMETSEKWVVVKLHLRIPAYGIDISTYGGNDNIDRGDAYKGAQTDALTKAASMLGIGAHVWKNGSSENQVGGGHKKSTTPSNKPTVQKTDKTCSECGGAEVKRIKGVSKAGKPYDMLKCTDCEKTVFLNQN